jgi:hypothetical protein
VAGPSPDPIPDNLSATFRSAVCGSIPIGCHRYRSRKSVCGLLDGFEDRMPDDVFEKLMTYMRDIRYTLLRQKIAAEQSYTAGARCFLRLIEDRKRECLRSE